MPMIDIYAADGTFADVHTLARNAAALVKIVEQVPDIPMFRNNTAAFVHEMPAGTLANVEGDSNYVRIQVYEHVINPDKLRLKIAEGDQRFAAKNRRVV